MGKHILVVEGDADLSASVRGELEGRGFVVQETGDGKSSIDLVKKDRPDLIVLAVDLPMGQNGYIICGKLKKDDDLKAIPVILAGSPDGFIQHKKLKTRADDYLAKPFEPSALVEKIGALVGFPEDGSAQVVDDGLNTLVDEPITDSNEIEVQTEARPARGDPELDLLDVVFDEYPEERRSAGGESASPEPEEAQSETSLVDDADAALADIQAGHSHSDGTDTDLRAKIAELESANADIQARLEEAERELDRRKGQDSQIEEERSAHAAELASKDEELSSMSQRVEQLTQERRRMEQQIATSKEESRNANAKHSEVQSRLTQTLTELEKAKRDLSAQSSRQEQLTAPLKSRIAELEESQAKHEQRLSKLFQRLKADEKVREKAKKALSIALQLLEEQGGPDESKEPAAA